MNEVLLPQKASRRRGGGCRGCRVLEGEILIATVARLTRGGRPRRRGAAVGRGQAV